MSHNVQANQVDLSGLREKGANLLPHDHEQNAVKFIDKLKKAQSKELALRSGKDIKVSTSDLVSHLDYLWYKAEQAKSAVSEKIERSLEARKGKYNDQQLSVLREKGSPEIYMKMTLEKCKTCLLYTSPSPRDRQKSRMPSSA